MIIITVKRKIPSKQKYLMMLHWILKMWRRQEEDKCHADLSGFSRTEVTVIDTSCGSWKFEKMLFRRKNVWKVRDKKSKGMINIGRKKRKASTLLGEDTFSIEKKPKLSSGQCSSLNVPPNEVSC